MAKPWSEVSGSEAFKSLSSAEKESARRQYFEQVVAPRVPKDDLQIARDQFLSQTAIPAKKEPESRNVGAVLNDTVISIANAAAGGVKSVADFFSPGTDFSKAVDEFIKQGEESQSDIVKVGREKFQKELQGAKTAGEEIAAVGRYVAENPLQAAGQAVGSFAGPGLAVKGATKTAQLLKASEKIAERVGLGAGIVTNAMMSGGDAAGSAYEMVMQTPDDILMQNDSVRQEVEKGRSLEDVKKEAATTAARRASASGSLPGRAHHAARGRCPAAPTPCLPPRAASRAACSPR
jgi:hypothetical protein